MQSRWTLFFPKTIRFPNLAHFSPVLRFKEKSVAHVEICCSAKQMTGFYTKHTTGLKWVKGVNATNIITFISHLMIAAMLSL